MSCERGYSISFESESHLMWPTFTDCSPCHIPTPRTTSLTT